MPSAFRLQRLLDLRRHREEEMRGRLGAATRARVAGEAVLCRRIEGEQRLREEVAVLLSAGRIDAARVQHLGLLLDAAALAITAQRTEVAQLAEQEHQARSRLTVAMSERKALDRLRERHEERERVEENRREAGILGEIAGTRTARAIAARRAAGA